MTAYINTKQVAAMIKALQSKDGATRMALVYCSGLNREQVARWIIKNRPLFHISGWARSRNGAMTLPIYKWGQQVDAPPHGPTFDNKQYAKEKRRRKRLVGGNELSCLNLLLDFARSKARGQKGFTLDEVAVAPAIAERKFAVSTLRCAAASLVKADRIHRAEWVYSETRKAVVAVYRFGPGGSVPKSAVPESVKAARKDRRASNARTAAIDAMIASRSFSRSVFDIAVR